MNHEKRLRQKKKPKRSCQNDLKYVVLSIVKCLILMQSFPIENQKLYSQMVSECQRIVEQTWENPQFRSEFQLMYLQDARLLLENYLQKNALNNQNCLFVIAGKSAAVSLTLLNSLAEHSSDPALKSLISSTLVLTDQENRDFYAGKVSSLLKTRSANRTLLFIDEHSEDYAKAVNFLSTADRNNLRSKFFVFAGRMIRPNVAVAEYGGRILKASAKDSIVDFLKNLGRLESERLRLLTQLNPVERERMGTSVMKELDFATVLLTSMKRQ